MNFKHQLVVVMISCLVPSINAFAAETDKKQESEVLASDIVARDGRLQAEAAVFQSPLGTLSFGMTDMDSQTLLRTKASPLPINLWLLIDVSKMCSVQKLDVYLTSLLSRLPRALDPSTTVSLATFTGSTRDIIAKQVPLSSIAGTKIACEPKYLSGSYEESLLRLMDNAANSNSPTKVWVLTSGNIRLSDKTLKEIKEREMQVDIFVYNTPLLHELTPVAQAQQAIAGESAIRMHPLLRNDGLVPARYYEVDGRIPAELQGKSLALQLSALSNGQAVGTVAMTAPASGKNGLSLLTLIEIIGAIATLLLVCWKIYQYYQAKLCPKCETRMRFDQQYCLFCAKAGDAFLVGTREILPSRTIQKTLMYLNTPVTELGTHRKSRLPFVRPQGEKRTCYLAIARETLGSDRIGYKAMRSAGHTSADISINGVPFLNVRYLASGDSIRINNEEFKFYVKRRTAHGQTQNESISESAPH